MTFLPRHMQFKPLNHLYEEGKNPWAVLNYENKIVVACGAKKLYEKLIIDKHELPSEITQYLLNSNTTNIVIREYPENSMSTMKVVSLHPKLQLDFLYDI